MQCQILFNIRLQTLNNTKIVNDGWNFHANTSKAPLVTTEMVCHGIFIISAPHNMGVDTLFVKLLSLLTEIWPKKKFFCNGGTNLHENGTWDIFPAC